MQRILASLLAALHVAGCATSGDVSTPEALPAAEVAVPAAPRAAVEPGMGVGDVLATEAAAVVAASAATASSVAVGASGLAASVWLAGAAPSVLFGMVFAAVFVSEGLGYEPPAPMDPNRLVNEQDCTKPIDVARGNLKCAPQSAK